MASVSALLVHIYNFVVNKQQQRSSAELGLRIWSAMHAPPHTIRRTKRYAKMNLSKFVGNDVELGWARQR